MCQNFSCVLHKSGEVLLAQSLSNHGHHIIFENHAIYSPYEQDSDYMKIEIPIPEYVRPDSPLGKLLTAYVEWASKHPNRPEPKSHFRNWLFFVIDNLVFDIARMSPPPPMAPINIPHRLSRMKAPVWFNFSMFYAITQAFADHVRASYINQKKGSYYMHGGLAAEDAFFWDPEFLEKGRTDFGFRGYLAEKVCITKPAGKWELSGISDYLTKPSIRYFGAVTYLSSKNLGEFAKIFHRSGSLAMTFKDQKGRPVSWTVIRAADAKAPPSKKPLLVGAVISEQEWKALLDNLWVDPRHLEASTIRRPVKVISGVPLTPMRNCAMMKYMPTIKQDFIPWTTKGASNPMGLKMCRSHIKIEEL